MIEDYKIVIISDIDFEKLIAEISYKERFIALLHQEDGVENVKIQFVKSIIDLDFNEFVTVLKNAREKLLPPLVQESIPRSISRSQAETNKIITSLKSLPQK